MCEQPPLETDNSDKTIIVSEATPIGIYIIYMSTYDRIRRSDTADYNYLKNWYLKVPSDINEYSLDTFPVLFSFQIILSHTSDILK